jgi:hypothetical protein
VSYAIISESPLAGTICILGEPHTQGVLRAELNVNSPYVHSRVDSNTVTMGNPLPESTLTLCQNRLNPPVRDFGLSY